MRLPEDSAEMPNGKTTLCGVCEFGQCVAVLPFVENKNVVMVRQYRYTHKENHRWEMPGGGVRPSETPEAAAARVDGRSRFLERAILPFDEVLELVNASEIRDTPKA